MTGSTAIAPWLSVRGSARAVEFYKAAFGAIELHRVDGGPKGVVAQLSVDGAIFWIGEESPPNHSFSPETLGGSSVKILLSVTDPDAAFARAIAAGAVQTYAVRESHGWRAGGVVDPFGHRWEIGRPPAG